MSAKPFVWSALLGFVMGCGGDDAAAAESACLDIAEAYARAWERCGRDTYENAYDAWKDALICDTVEVHDGAKVNDCVDDLAAQSCAAVETNASPPSCTNALGG